MEHHHRRHRRRRRLLLLQYLQRACCCIASQRLQVRMRQYSLHVGLVGKIIGHVHALRCYLPTS